MKKTIYSITAGFFSLLSVSSQAQIISTIAGDHTAFGYSGDGGAATASKMSTPVSSAIDAAGNIYIADDNNVIRKINTSGIITTVVGTGAVGLSGDGSAATAATLKYPYGMCFDAAGNLYFADYQNSRIRKVDPSGIITTVAGTTGGYSGDGGAATAAQINYPTDVKVDASGNIFICDWANHFIRKVNSAGIISTIAGGGSVLGDGGAATAGMLDNPKGICLDASGNLYIADYGHSRIRKVDAGGTITTIAGTGTAGYSGDGSAATAAEMKYPFSVTMDVAGNLFFGDDNNYVVRKIDQSGIISTIGGGGLTFADGGPATATELYAGYMTFTATGDLIVPDRGDDCVRKITAATIALSGTTTICKTNTTTISNATGGGVWSSSNTAVATVSTSGVVTGTGAGTATIAYTMGLGYGATAVTINDCSLSVTPFDHMKEPRVFPNPSEGSFTIKLPEVNGDATVTLNNMLGQSVVTMQLNPSQKTVIMNNVAAGNYVVKVVVGDNTYRTKVVVNR